MYIFIFDLDVNPSQERASHTCVYIQICLFITDSLIILMTERKILIQEIAQRLREIGDKINPIHLYFTICIYSLMFCYKF